MKKKYIFLIFFFIYKLSIYCGFCVLLFLTLNGSEKCLISIYLTQTSSYSRCFICVSTCLHQTDYFGLTACSICYALCDYRKHLRFCSFSLFSTWCFFYFGHLILFPVLSIKLSLLGPVDVVVICDLVEEQIMDSRGMAKCSQYNLMKFFTSIITFQNAVAYFHFHPTSLSSRECSSFNILKCLEIVLKTFDTEISPLYLLRHHEKWFFFLSHSLLLHLLRFSSLTNCIADAILAHVLERHSLHKQ